MPVHANVGKSSGVAGDAERRWPPGRQGRSRWRAARRTRRSSRAHIRTATAPRRRRDRPSSRPGSRGSIGSRDRGGRLRRPGRAHRRVVEGLPRSGGDPSGKGASSEARGRRSGQAGRARSRRCEGRMSSYSSLSAARRWFPLPGGHRSFSGLADYPTGTWPSLTLAPLFAGSRFGFRPSGRALASLRRSSSGTPASRPIPTRINRDLAIPTRSARSLSASNSASAA